MDSMNKNNLPLLAAISLLIGMAPQAFAQSMGRTFEVRPQADMSWHPVSQYVSNVCDSVRAGWKPEDGEDSESAIVSFVVNKDGSKSAIVLKHSTGVKKLDQAALDAVSHSANCGAVPEQRQLPLNMELTFRTCMPKVYYSPSIDRDVSAVLYVPNDEKKIDDPANYPAKIIDLLSQKWNFKAPPTQPGDDFIVRCKLAKDGTIVARKILRSCSSPGLDAAAMKLLDEIKALPPLAAELPQSRFIYLGFEPVDDPVDKQILAYKSETALQMRFNSLVERAVYAHWRPVNAEKLTGIAHLYLTLNSDGTLKKIQWFKKSHNSADNRAALRAVKEALPIKPPCGSEKKVGVYFDASVDPSTLPIFERNVCTGGEYISIESDQEETEKNIERRKSERIAQDAKQK
jgi:TonB family protein